MEPNTANKSLSILKNFKLFTVIIYNLTLLFLFLAIALFIFIVFNSLAGLDITQGINDWHVIFNFNQNQSIRFQIPYSDFQKLPLHMINMKALLLSHLFFDVIIKQLIAAFCLSRIKLILKRSLEGASPFLQCNVTYLRQLALLILGGSFFIQPLYSFAMHHFAAGLFSINFQLEFMSYELYNGIIIFILAEIFNYGIYLQSEYDTTL